MLDLYNRSTKWEGNKNIIGNFNLPQDVANLVLWLASNEAKFVTGSVVVVVEDVVVVSSV